MEWNQMNVGKTKGSIPWLSLSISVAEERLQQGEIKTKQAVLNVN